MKNRRLARPSRLHRPGGTPGFSTGTWLKVFLGWAATVMALAGANSSRVKSEISFPRIHRGQAATLVMHAPQVDSWHSEMEMITWQAVQATLQGSTDSYLGAVQARLKTYVDLASREVEIRDATVLQAHFPGAEKSTAEAIVKELSELLRKEDVVYPLDLVVNYIEKQKEKLEPPRLRAAPPKIFYRDSPAILVVLRGGVVFNPLPAAKLEFAVNTNWDLFRDTEDRTLYLLDGERWLRATSLDGPWQSVQELPTGFSRLPRDGNWGEARRCLRVKSYDDPPPEVVVHNAPAELIVTDGRPELAPIAETDLSYVSNTDSDLLWHEPSERYYFLVAGRWFKAPDVNGPWESGHPLPETFVHIPPDSPRADVRFAVPGTWEAGLAVFEAGLPQRGSVDRRTAPEKVKVAYYGEPKFERIPDTTLQYAVNTASDVIRRGNDYFLCDHAAWFSGNSPRGPWKLADVIPEDIAKIPPRSPVYRVRFVGVHKSNATSVEFEYTAGYQNVYVDNDKLVFGTGHWYSPTWSTERGMSYWIPYYSTYGSQAYLDPYLGRFRSGGRRYGPFGGQVLGVTRDPAGGNKYRRGDYSPPSGRLESIASIEPRTQDTRVAIMHVAQPYAKWAPPPVSGETIGLAQRMPETAAPTAAPPVAIPGAGIVQPAAGGLFVAQNGDVYRPSPQGWLKWSDAGWTAITAAAARKQQEALNAEYERRLGYKERELALREQRLRYAQASRPRYVIYPVRYRYPVFHKRRIYVGRARPSGFR